MLGKVDNHFFGPVSYAGLNAPQVGPFGHQGTLLTHIELPINPKPQIPFCKAALQPLVPQSTHTSRIIPSQVQNLAFVLVKHHMVGDCSEL